jgi:hypothetical protein
MWQRLPRVFRSVVELCTEFTSVPSQLELSVVVDAAFPVLVEANKESCPCRQPHRPGEALVVRANTGFPVELGLIPWFGAEIDELGFVFR